MNEPIDYQKEFIKYISSGRLVPVISNSFRLDEIFRNDAELLKTMKQKPDYYDEIRTIDQQLTKQWAKEIVSYPMSDDHNLARVAQYHQVLLGDAEQAKNDYLSFINERLLNLYQNKEGYQDTVNEFRKTSLGLNFSKVVYELNAPEYPDSKKDPLRLLAQMNFPVFITTSYFTFIERALIQENKKPVTLYWHWGDESKDTKLEYLNNPDLNPEKPPDEPSVQNPVVYHLFGIEDVPESLVISEDDYINFLMKATEDSREEDLFPSGIRDAIVRQPLLLMGYNLREWDFRALFRFLSRFRKGDRDQWKSSMAIQLKPSLNNQEMEKKSLDYLETYVGKKKFEVKWIDNKQFVYELADSWKNIKR